MKNIVAAILAVACLAFAEVVNAEVPAKAEVEKPITYVGCYAHDYWRSQSRHSIVLSKVIDSQGHELRDLEELFLLYAVNNHATFYEYAKCFLGDSPAKVRIAIGKAVREYEPPRNVSGPGNDCL